MFGNERRLARIEGKLDLILNLQRFFARMELTNMSAISDAVANLTTKVTGLTTVVDSTGAALAGLSQLVKDLTAKLAETADVLAAIESLNQLSTAIDEQSARRLVELVLHRLAAGRHLDDDVEVVWRRLADRNEVDAHG